jgi:NAD+ kinase
LKQNRKEIRTVGLLANVGKPASRQAVRTAVGLIQRAGREVAFDAATVEFCGLKHPSQPSAAALAKSVDLLLVFGGDGTILQVVRDIQGAATPILGVNVGRLGFLTAVPFQQLSRVLEQVWAGDYEMETRPLMQASGECRASGVATVALNDIVISHGTVSRLIELEVCVNRQLVTCYRGDGLIVSSPTGSTAYSLSAGGPIISPEAAVLVITPICPHTLTNRSVVVSAQAAIQVRLVSENVETIVSADGQVQTPMSPGDVICISRSRRAMRLLHPGGVSFFETVRKKLQWRGSSV